MIRKTKLYSIFNFTCPRCHRGKFFKGKVYTYSRSMGQHNGSCSHCGLNYKIEPGFYQGSYYVSYALGVALFVSLAVLVYLFDEIRPSDLFLKFLLLLFISVPLIYSLSKIIWINMFVDYDDQILQKLEVEKNKD